MMQFRVRRGGFLKRKTQFSTETRIRIAGHSDTLQKKNAFKPFCASSPFRETEGVYCDHCRD